MVLAPFFFYYFFAAFALARAPFFLWYFYKLGRGGGSGVTYVLLSGGCVG